MNLLELKRQAGIDDNPDQEGLDLFAQLIVQECVYEIKMTMVRDGYDTKHYLQSRKHIEHICKHFGVEP